MRKRKLSEDIVEELEATHEETIRLLEEFKTNEMWEKTFRNTLDTRIMQGYVNRLQQEGLDIGKGDTTFGYRMPLSDKRAPHRVLQIYRRK